MSPVALGTSRASFLYRNRTAPIFFLRRHNDLQHFEPFFLNFLPILFEFFSCQPSQAPNPAGIRLPTRSKDSFGDFGLRQIEMAFIRSACLIVAVPWAERRPGRPTTSPGHMAAVNLSHSGERLPAFPLCSGGSPAKALLSSQCLLSGLASLTHLQFTSYACRCIASRMLPAPLTAVRSSLLRP